jgi:N-acetylglucosamine-6-phosphate deacetylase
MKPLDLQVNGYAGVDFNGDDLSADGLRRACEALSEDGVGGILATVITDSPAAMKARIARLAELRESDPLFAEMIVGIHIEGPFLNSSPGFIGAHPPEHACDASPDAAGRLVDAGGGLVKIVTLAPERDPGFATITALADLGITVAAGHCDPTLDQLRGAIDAGLKMFTHLGNACANEVNRHDNIVQRVLSLSDELFISVIPDGAHIPLFALKNYLKAIPPGRAIAVTDAISAARLPPGRHPLGAIELEVGEDGIARLPGTPYLAGSTATMPQVIAKLREIGLDEDAVRQMTIDNPRQAIR